MEDSKLYGQFFMKKITKEEILEKHCPSMNDLFLDKEGRLFRDKILAAMDEYYFSNSNIHVSKINNTCNDLK